MGEKTANQASASSRWFAVAVVALLGAIGLYRFVQTRDLVLPAWVDSIHHTLLTRILLEQGRIPETWAPYLPEVPLYYHFGFHVSAALLARLLGLTGIELGRAVEITGLLWQVACAGAVSVLVSRLWGSRRATLLSLILIGFVSPMPAFYLSWGRYTLLAGVTVLLWGMVAALSRIPGLLALAVAVAAVTHYYALLLLVGFSVACALTWQPLRARIALALEVALGLALASPWLTRVWVWTETYQRAARGEAGRGAAHAGVLSMLGPGRNYVLLFLAGLGLWLALKRWRAANGTDTRASHAFVLWSLGLFAMLGPWQIGPFRPDHAAIVAFVAIVPLAAYALSSLPRQRLTATVIGLLVVWGIAETSRLVPPHLRLANRADLAAIRWIAEHTPQEATCLLDATPWMGVWRGVDGGWWITPLSGRRTIPPPISYSWGEPELTGLVRIQGERSFRLNSLEVPSYCDALERLMMESSASYYFTHRDRPRWCPRFRLAYELEGVRVYALKQTEPAS